MTYVLFVPWRRAEAQVIKPIENYEGKGVPGYGSTSSMAPIRFGDADAAKAKAGYSVVSFPGQEYASKNGEWIKLASSNSVGKEKEFFQVWYDGSPKVQLIMLQDGQVYIRGHGLPGSPNISSENKDHMDAFQLSAGEVAKRLYDSGLPTTFAGKVKCYNCHSADAGHAVSSFGQLFANAMWKLGFKQCRFFAYYGSLTSYYESRTGQDHMHKYARQSDGEDIRASKARMEITPAKS